MLTKILTPAANDEDTASRLISVFDKEGVQELNDLRRFSVDELTALLGSAGIPGNVAREKASDLNERIKGAIPKKAAAIRRPSIVPPNVKTETIPSKTARVATDGIISGTLVQPHGFAQLDTIEVLAYADPDLNHESDEATATPLGISQYR